MPSDKLDQLYDALKKDGAVSKSRENFRSKMLAPGNEGYKNRKALYDALKADGAISSPTYEVFASKLFSGGEKKTSSAGAQHSTAQPATHNGTTTAGLASSFGAIASNLIKTVSSDETLRAKGKANAAKTRETDSAQRKNIVNDGGAAGQQQVQPKAKAQPKQDKTQPKAEQQEKKQPAEKDLTWQERAALLADFNQHVANTNSELAKTSAIAAGRATDNGDANRNRELIVNDKHLLSNLVQGKAQDIGYQYNRESGMWEHQYLTSQGVRYTDRKKADAAERAYQQYLRSDLGLQLGDETGNPIMNTISQTKAKMDMQQSAYEAVKDVYSEAEKAYAADRNNNAQEVYSGSQWLQGGREFRTIDAATKNLKNDVSELHRFDLQKIADDTWMRCGALMTQKVLKEMRTKHPYATESQLERSAEKFARALCDDAVYNYALEHNAPKNALDYFGKKIKSMNLVNYLTRGAARSLAGTTGSLTAEEAAMANYEGEHGVQKVIGTVAGVAFDPTTYIGGIVGNAVGKGALRFAGNIAFRGAGKGVGARILGSTLGGKVLYGTAAGAGNLATFQGVHAAADQWMRGGYLNPETGELEDYNVGAVAGATAEGALLGTATGVVSPLVGNVADKAVKATASTGGKVAIRGGEVVLSTLAEGTIFAIPEWFSGNGDKWDIWLDSTATMVGFKAKSTVSSTLKRIRSLRPVTDPKTMAERNHNRINFEERVRKNLDASSSDIAFTDVERAELKERGYGKLSALFAYRPKDKTTAEDTEGTTKATVEEMDADPTFDGYTSMEQLMQDKTVSQSTRAKAYYMLTGRMLPMGTVTSYETETGADGSIYVKSISNNGEVVTRKRFTSQDAANREIDVIKRQAELNTIDVGEQYRESAANYETLRSVAEDVANATADFAGKNAEDMTATAKTAKEIMDIYVAAKRGDKEKAEEYADIIDAVDNALEGKADMMQLERPEGIRERIKNRTGIDVDEAIKKMPAKRTKEEQDVVEEYVRRLFPDKTEQREQIERDAEEVHAAGEAVYAETESEDAEVREEALDKVEEIKARVQQAKLDAEMAFEGRANEWLPRLEEDPWALLEDPTLSQYQQDIVVSYINSKAALDGVRAASENALEAKRQNAVDTVERYTHKDTQTIVPATLKVDDKPVYIVKGHVEMFPDGTAVDARKSDSSIIVYDVETGEYKFVSPDQISKIGKQRDPQTDRDAAVAQVEAEHVDVVDGGPRAGESGDRYVADREAMEREGVTDERVQPTVDYRNGKLTDNHYLEEIGYSPEEVANMSEEQRRIKIKARIEADKQYIKDTKVAEPIKPLEEEPLHSPSRAEEELPAERTEEEPLYKQGDWVVASSGERLQVVATEDGGKTYRVLRPYLGEELRFSADELKPAPAPDAENATSETPITAEAAAVPAAEQAATGQAASAEQPKAEVEPMPMRADNGEEDWQATTPERAHSYIYNEAGLTRRESNDFVAAKLEEAKKTLRKAQSAQMPHIGTSIQKYRQAQAKRQEKIDEAQRAVEYWNRVREIQNGVQQQENERKAAEDAARHDAAVEEAQKEYEARKQAEAERKAVGNENPMPSITDKWNGAKKYDGDRDDYKIADGTTLKGHYVLHESGASSPSHNPQNWQQTEGFPMDANDNSVNDRDYEHDRDAQEHTKRIAENYDQRALQDVPVVSADGVVLSGNGRTMAGELAAQNNTDSEYVEYLKEHAHKFGFTREQVESMQHPRVSFVPDEAMPYTAETFSRFNQQAMKSQNKTEQAVKLGKTVSDESFKQIVRTINGYDSLSEFYADPNASLGAVYALHNAGVIPQAQLAEMVDGVPGQQRLSAVGREFLENMLIGKAFDSDPEVVRMLTAEPAMRQTVITALGEIADNIALGGEWSVKQELADAVKLCFDARTNGAQYGDIVSIYARQGELFAAPDQLQTMADFKNATMLMLADVLNDKRVTLLKTTLQLYNNDARLSASGQADLFAGGVKSREDILRGVVNYINENYGKRKELDAARAAAVERRKAESVQQNGSPEEGRGDGETGNTEASEVRNDGRGSGVRSDAREGDLAQTENGTSEVDENGHLFVKASDGGFIFGEITSRSGLTEAPIKLSEGFNIVDEDGNNHGYGLLHIQAERGEQILEAGYSSVAEFVEDVTKNYQEIRIGRVRKGNQTYMLLEFHDEQHKRTLYVELSHDGSYWNVNSGGIFRNGYSEKKDIVWPEPTVRNSANTDATEVVDSPAAAAKGVTVDRGGNSSQTISSEGKVINKSSKEQAAGEKSAEGSAKSTYERKRWNAESDLEEMKARNSYLAKACQNGTAESAEVFPEKEEYLRENQRLSRMKREGLLNDEECRKILAEKFGDFLHRRRQVQEEGHELQRAIRDAFDKKHPFVLSNGNASEDGGTSISPAESQQPADTENISALGTSSAAKVSTKSEGAKGEEKKSQGGESAEASDIDIERPETWEDGTSFIVAKGKKKGVKLVYSAQFTEPNSENIAFFEAPFHVPMMYDRKRIIEELKSGELVAANSPAGKEAAEAAKAEWEKAKAEREKAKERELKERQKIDDYISQFKIGDVFEYKGKKYLLVGFRGDSVDLKRFDKQGVSTVANWSADKKKFVKEYKKVGHTQTLSEWLAKKKNSGLTVGKKGATKVDLYSISESADGDGRTWHNVVHYENGYACATNGRILAIISTPYPKEYEGKNVSVNGEVKGEDFPHITDIVSMQGEEISPYSFVAAVEEAEKKLAEMRKLNRAYKKRLKEDSSAAPTAEEQEAISEKWDNVSGKLEPLEKRDEGYSFSRPKDMHIAIPVQGGFRVYSFVYAQKVAAVVRKMKNVKALCNNNVVIFVGDGAAVVQCGKEFWEGDVSSIEVLEKTGLPYFIVGKKGPQFQTSDASLSLSTPEQRMAYDAVNDLLAEAGVEVEMLSDEEMRRMAEESEERRWKKGTDKKRALETVSVSRGEEHQQTVISSADGAKILNNLDTLARDYENSSHTNEKTFIGAVAKALGAERDGSKSEYATFETKNGKIVTIRLADHNAKVSTFDNRGELDGISIVVSAKENEGMTNDGSAHLTEFFYDAIKLRRAEGKPLAEIVKSIKQALYSGEFKDTTGLAQRQEVNEGDARFHEETSKGEGKKVLEGSEERGERHVAEQNADGTYTVDGESGLRPEYKTTERLPEKLNDEKYLTNYNLYAGIASNMGLNAAARWKRQNTSQVPYRSAFPTPTLEDYYVDTGARFNGVELGGRSADEVWEEMKSSGKYEWHKSPVSDSEYLIDAESGEVYRKADHWGRVASCTWLLPNEEKFRDADGFAIAHANIKDFEAKETDRHMVDNPNTEGFGHALRQTIVNYTDALNNLPMTEKARGWMQEAIASAQNALDYFEKSGKTNRQLRMLRNDATVYGAMVGSKMYLNAEHLNVETPVHEYTHMWDEMCARKNPELWKRGVALMKACGIWDEVANDPAYQGLDEFGIASECHARLTGRHGAETLERLAQGAKDKRGVIGKLREWLSEFWYWLRDTMLPWSAKEAGKVKLEDFVNMPLVDLAKGRRMDLATQTVAEVTRGNGKRFDVKQERDAEAEVREIVEKAKADGTYMKAPNGKDSKLNERQWAQVRTKAFKNWFGDWENDPENSSKVVDENGEPMVVYHGTRTPNITMFDLDKTLSGRAFWFANAEAQKAVYYGGQEDSNLILMPLFVDMKSPLLNDADSMEPYASDETHDGGLLSGTLSEFKLMGLSDEEYNELIDKGLSSDSYLVTGSVAKPNQLKSATDNEGTFSASNPDIRFHISRRNGETIDRLLDKGGLFDEKGKAAFRTYVENEEPSAQLAMAKWAGNGSIRLPEDRPTVDEALKICRKDKLDAMRYDSPGAIVKEWRDKNVDEEAEADRVLLSPDEERFSGVLTNKREYAGGVTVYDVADTREGQKAVRELMNDHLTVDGKHYNCWCLLYASESTGELSDNAWNYWNHYNSVQKKVAFKDGKIVSFCASDSGRDEWWDLSDQSHGESIPIEMKLPNDRLGRSAIVGFNPASGESVSVGKKFSGNKKNGLYREWNEDDVLVLSEHYKGRKLDGVRETWHENGQMQVREHYKNGLRDGLLETWYENGQQQFRRNYNLGEPDGIQEGWHENGKRWHRENWKNMKLEGLEEIWNVDGTLQSRAFYQNGLRVPLPAEYADGARYRTSEELTAEYGDRWLSEQTNEDGRHTTQVKNTINSYKKFGEWVKADSNGKEVSILDASSGLGLGTEWLRENGMEVDDVEPYPSENRVKPTFTSYDEINKKYDYIVSNAVLNVIPDDWRANVLHNMADKLKVGGKMLINVRGASSIAKQGKEGATRITLDEPSEILVTRPDGSIKSYQKGFTKDELKSWCEKELGDGYTVEIASNKNAGGSYDTAVVVTKQTENKSAKSEEAKVARVNELSESLHTPVRIVRTAEEAAQLPSARERRMKGKYDTRTGEVTVVVANNADVADVENTVLHEVVGHDGLRVLFPEEGTLNNALDELYSVSSDGIKAEIDQRTQKMYDAEVGRLREQKRKAHEANGEDPSATYFSDMAEAHAEASKKREQFRREATEEYGADLAGRIGEKGFEKMTAEEQTFWGKLKAMLQKALQRLLDGLKIKTRKKWTDKEWSFVLHEAYKRKKNGGKPSVFDVADTAAMRTKTGYDMRAQSDASKTETPREMSAEEIDTYEHEKTQTMFRDGDAEEYKRAHARDAYERRVQTGMYQSKEALQDSMLGLREAMEGIMKAEGKKLHVEDIPDYENAYLGENALSSVNLAQANEFSRELFKPMLEEASKLAKTNRERQELIDYMIAKHGLERNDLMAARAAARQAAQEYAKALSVAQEAVAANPLDPKALADLQAVQQKQKKRENDLYNANRNRDYAGLTGLFERDNVVDAEADARDLVQQYEVDHNTADLWDKVKAVNEFTLHKTYMSGIIDRATYDNIRGMYQNYIPLRGFDETTSEDVYGYLDDQTGKGGSVIKHAEGRKSKAEDPFAYMAQMAESAISQGNRNVLVKQRFMNFALAHPSDLISVSDVWLRYDDVAGEWKAVFTGDVAGTQPLEANDSSAEIEQKIKDFNDAMQTLASADPDHFKRQKDIPDVPYLVVEKQQMTEHQVRVKRNGRDYILTINGNPRAAQAVNGATNPDNVKGLMGYVLNTMGWVNRQLSAFYTTRWPDFILSNFLRDAQYSNTEVWVKESSEYAKAFHANYAKLNPAKMKALFTRLRNGTLDMNDNTDKLFYQFIMNGGETGYTQVRDIEKHKNEIRRQLKMNNGQLPIRKAWRYLGERMDEINRTVENCARFAAFCTSQQMGRSLGRSIWDAKDISVNFNKKGAGSTFFRATGQTFAGSLAAALSGFGRSNYIFWNAGMQGQYNKLRNLYRNPKKGIAALAAFATLGFLMALINDDDDDEKSGYYDLPEYVRRTSIVFRLPYVQEESWVSIPLSIEYRSVYGIGEIFGSIMTGNEQMSNGELANAIAAQLSQTLPLDALEGGGGLSPFYPSYVKQVAEIIENKSWTGLPIYKDYQWNKTMPEWTKAYKSANRQLVDASKWLNEFSGGDDYKSGSVDINPSMVEHLLRGYFGGAFEIVNQAVKTGEMIFGDREYDPRNIPLVNRVIKQGDERTESRSQKNKYYRLRDEYKETHRLESKYEDAVDDGKTEYEAKLKELRASDAYQRMLLYEDYGLDIESIDKDLKDETITDEERKELEAEKKELMKKYLEEVDKLREKQ